MIGMDTATNDAHRAAMSATASPQPHATSSVPTSGLDTGSDFTSELTGAGARPIGISMRQIPIAVRYRDRCITTHHLPWANGQIVTRARSWPLEFRSSASVPSRRGCRIRVHGYLGTFRRMGYSGTHNDAVSAKLTAQDASAVSSLRRAQLDALCVRLDEARREEDSARERLTRAGRISEGARLSAIFVLEEARRNRSVIEVQRYYAQDRYEEDRRRLAIAQQHLNALRHAIAYRSAVLALRRIDLDTLRRTTCRAPSRQPSSHSRRAAEKKASGGDSGDGEPARPGNRRTLAAGGAP